MTRRAPTLRRKLAKLIATTTLVSLLVFCAIAYVVIYLEEDMGLDVVPEADDQATEFLILAFGVAAPISLAVTLTGALWVARRALVPIEEVIRAAAEMSVDHLGRRLALPPDRDELHEMVRTLNGLFARLEAGFQGLHSFAADVSHELRTPLAIIINELEVVSRRPRTEAEWQEAASHALVTLRRLVSLVESLLELARGGIAGARDEVDLTSLADEVVNTLSVRAEATELQLVHDSQAAVTAVANRAALATALSAIVENAIRYTPRGGRIAVTIDAPDRHTATIRVEDNGPGIAPEERDSIFAPLVRGTVGRAADAENPDQGGLGLGLAIVRRVAE